MFLKNWDNAYVWFIILSVTIFFLKINTDLAYWCKARTLSVRGRGGRREAACEMIAKSLLQSHDHKNLNYLKLLLFYPRLSNNKNYIINDFTIGFYGHVSSAGNRKDHFAIPLAACHICLIHIENLLCFTTLNPCLVYCPLYFRHKKSAGFDVRRGNWNIKVF